ncbi:MAG: radical SAM protein [Clostridia bacterium]|nr:radical SAM protein [Clostridia bacterium]
MHFTLHLTDHCNMACSYCYIHKKNSGTMSMDTAKKVIDLAAKSREGSNGIIFFGGEPLLYKDLIYQTVEYCKWKQQKENCYFHYKVTTNGLLLDEAFIDFSIKENLFIALSHDGVREAHDKHRVDVNGEGTFFRLSGVSDALLEARPYSPVMMVISPDTAEYFTESVEYLFSRGFKYVISSLNYAGNWTEPLLKVLKREYEKLAEVYIRKTLAEDKFYFSPFEVKISSHINRETYCQERCELGKKQISVAYDGMLYPCVQFVGEEAFSIGHVNTGIDESRRLGIYHANEEEKESCVECAVKSRCNHYCGCLNKQTTGNINQVSPVLCAHERIVLPIADKIAEKLYRKRNAMFIQKHYNDMFPLVSMIEDISASNRKRQY